MQLPWLKSMARVDMLHVPYKGGGPAIIDVIAGQCDFLVVNVGPVLGHIHGGKLTALAVTSKTRSHVMMEGEMPNTGALIEQLAVWVPDEAARKKILVDNPARLYRF